MSSLVKARSALCLERSGERVEASSQPQTGSVVLSGQSTAVFHLVREGLWSIY